MPRGGARPGAGRKPGAAAKKTREAADRLAAEGVTPLDVMCQMLNGTRPFDANMLEVAKAAAPYMHPRLGAVDHTSGGKPMGYLMAPNEAGTTEEWEQQHSPTAH